jgi:hypothetical protein
MYPFAVSSSKGVQININNCKLILKQLSIIPIHNKGLSLFKINHEFFNFFNNVSSPLLNFLINLTYN